MAKAYAPGLKVTSRTVHRARRLLPIAGDVLVKAGQRVKPRDIVAETFMPGDITPVNLANVLSLQAADVPGAMLKREGENVSIDEPIARTKGIFGMFKSEYRSKVAGRIEAISGVTGQLMIRGEPLPVRVLAYVEGVVAEVLPGEGCVIETTGSFIQGIFGVGGETFGAIRMACVAPTQELTEDLITPDMKGQVIIGGARLTATALERARKVCVAAVVAGGIDDQDLKEFLGYDLGVAITGSEQVGLTLIITEGFGDIAMADRTFKLFVENEGREASVNGATQIRAGVMRPEIIIPLADAATGNAAGRGSEGLLEIGTPVRIIRDPYFGLIGTVGSLPPEPHVLGSGSKARVLEVKFDSGEHVVVPRANVELIEGT